MAVQLPSIHQKLLPYLLPFNWVMEHQLVALLPFELITSPHLMLAWAEPIINDGCLTVTAKFSITERVRALMLLLIFLLEATNVTRKSQLKNGTGTMDT
jgi:hypothetical protein